MNPRALVLSAMTVFGVFATSFANAQSSPIDIFFRADGSQIDQQSGIYFQWRKAQPTPNASSVDAKDLVVRSGDKTIVLNVQMDYEGTDFANCQKQPGTQVSGKLDLTGSSIVVWHESMVCRNIEINGNRRDLLVRLDIDNQTGSIEVKDNGGSTLAKMNLKRK